MYSTAGARAAIKARAAAVNSTTGARAAITCRRWCKCSITGARTAINAAREMCSTTGASAECSSAMYSTTTPLLSRCCGHCMSTAMYATSLLPQQQCANVTPQRLCCRNSSLTSLTPQRLCCRNSSVRM